jgi:DNA-binding NarL/FixJ family response regulator
MIAPDALTHVFEPLRPHAGTSHLALPNPRALTPAEARQALRREAIAADTSGTTDVNLVLLWRELARGTSLVVDEFFCEDRCYLVLALRTDGRAAPIEGRRLEILEAVLGGVRQKNVAIDLKLAPSTVALNSRLGLEALGVCGKPSRAHPLLMLAANAINQTTLVSARCSSFVTHGDRELRVIGITRPDRHLSSCLPPAELAVIRCLIEGLSYREIARQRGTSTRTIANQITAVFRRMRVSGRNELVQRLFLDGARGGLPAPNAKTLAPPDTVRATPLSGARRSA